MARTSPLPSSHLIQRALAAAAAALVASLAIGPWVMAGAPSPAPVAIRAACSLPAPGNARCHALVRTDVQRSSRPLTAASAAATPAAAPLYPADLQAAYGLTAAAASSGAGATVAVVDAYDDPTAEADLAVYRSSLGLPACTSASGCFTKVNQSGGTSFPPFDGGWASEIAMDLEMVSAICPNCSILLVEANSEKLSDLGTGVNRAVAMGAKYVSNSYGVFESPSETSWDAAWFTHPGVVITASSGDFGYGVQFPAASPHVVAVGGTSLIRGAGGTWSQAAWPQAGSGCSAYEPKPSWQSDPGCAKRTVVDVAAVADPSTGVAVYYSGGWYLMGGTSAAAPIVAATYALAGPTPVNMNPASFPYLRGGLTDVVGGSNGTCGAQPYLCQAVTGYDGPTGLGAPAGTMPFTAPGVPGSPLAVSGVADDRSVTVSWSQPASDGGAPITRYTAASSPGGGTCTWAAGPMTCTVSGLTNGQPYTFTVTATNAAGTGAASSPSPTVTPRTVPGQPQHVTGTPGVGLVVVSWEAPVDDGGALITGYVATASPGGATCTATPPTTSCTVSGLVLGQGYTFVVTAGNAAGAGLPSPASAAVTPRTVPGAPTGVLAQPGNGSARVTWSAPSSDGGAAITGYTVTTSPGGSTCTWSTGPLECTVTGLANGGGYTFTVVATNAAGTGPASSPSGGAMPMSLPAAPAAVTAVPAATAEGHCGRLLAGPGRRRLDDHRLHGDRVRCRQLREHGSHLHRHGDAAGDRLHHHGPPLGRHVRRARDGNHRDRHRAGIGRVGADHSEVRPDARGRRAAHLVAGGAGRRAAAGHAWRRLRRALPACPLERLVRPVRLSLDVVAERRLRRPARLDVLLQRAGPGRVGLRLVRMVAGAVHRRAAGRSQPVAERLVEGRDGLGLLPLDVDRLDHVRRHRRPHIGDGEAHRDRREHLPDLRLDPRVLGLDAPAHDQPRLVGRRESQDHHRGRVQLAPLRHGDSQGGNVRAQGADRRARHQPDLACRPRQPGPIRASAGRAGALA